jgi:ribonuclease HII
MINIEKNLHKLGFKYIIGIDEVNVYSIAGDLIAVSVILDRSVPRIISVTDSKLLTSEQIAEIYPEVVKSCKFISIGRVTPKEIDSPASELGYNMKENKKDKTLNIYWASVEAKCRSLGIILKEIKYNPKSIILCDGQMPGKQVQKRMDLKQVQMLSVDYGDLKIYSIACASIIARYEHDKCMKELDKLYPEYDLVNNSGCPTKKHLEAIKLYGLKDFHRKQFYYKNWGFNMSPFGYNNNGDKYGNSIYL